VFRVGLANHPHDTFSTDDLAVFTNPPDACSYFHDILFNDDAKKRRIGICSLKIRSNQVLTILFSRDAKRSALLQRSASRRG
jgi:hypothetical protein